METDSVCSSLAATEKKRTIKSKRIYFHIQPIAIEVFKSCSRHFRSRLSRKVTAGMKAETSVRKMKSQELPQHASKRVLFTNGFRFCTGTGNDDFLEKDRYFLWRAAHFYCSKNHS